jgi:hypothetical protein
VFTADELLQSGLAPEELLKAQGFDPAPLAQLKFDRDQTSVLPRKWTRNLVKCDVSNGLLRLWLAAARLPPATPQRANCRVIPARLDFWQKLMYKLGHIF